MDNRSEEFIEAFKKFEDSCRIMYKLGNSESLPRGLEERHKLTQYASEIKYCQEVRNLLQHKYKINESYAVYPSQEMIDLLRKLTELVENRPKCTLIGVHEKDIFSRKMGDSILETVRIMRKRGYSHIPIVNNGQVIGVFNENSLFNYLADEGSINLEKDTVFSEKMLNYIGFERKSQQFAFVSAETYVDELFDLYERSNKSRKRLVVIFVTKHGYPNEHVVGLITPWDILGSGYL